MYTIKIYVIVSTLEQKVTLLDRGLGLEADHIFWPLGKRTAQQIRDTTNGRGIDVIYSYSNESLTNSCQHCLAAFGRLIELRSSGNSKAHVQDLLGFPSNATFSSIDLNILIAERPTTAAR